MQISLKWIQNYIDVSDYMQKPDQLADLLTNTGLEVESVHDYSKKFSNIVVGYILEKAQHPDADKLSVCQVEIKPGVVQQIVCGAKNHKQGDKVVAALPGAILPGDFAIKQSVIRGVESNGMLCSEKELGLSQESDGIMILASDVAIGTAFSQYQGLDDILFELKVTPNRADCLSHFGLARELSCLLDRPVKKPDAFLELSQKSSKEKVQLQVEETNLCPRYLGRYIEGVKVGPSPIWLKQAVESVGMNSINNVVDVTNFVMMEMGQPLHAFDAALIGGAKVQVALAKKAEKFTSLDGSEYVLDGSELMIRDANGPVALAGVVGGKNSGVSEETQNLFVECAYFTPETVRKTSRKLGIETDSAYRFSRGVDVNNMEYVLDRCCHLLQKVAGGSVYADPYDNYPNPIQEIRFQVHVDYVSQRLGYKVDAKSLLSLLERLDCKPKDLGGGAFEVVSPSFRVDIARAEDIVEEYARIFSYDAIPTKMPQMDVEPSPHSKEYRLHRMIRSYLVGDNWQEALNYNFVNAKFQEDFLGDKEKLKQFGVSVAEKAIEVLNPLNEDFSVMRTSLSPSILKNIQHNSRHGRNFGRLFEIGYAFGRDSEFGQDERLAFGIWGEQEGLWKRAKCPSVLELKSSVEDLLLFLKAKSWKWIQNPETTPEFLHPGQSASLFYEGRVIGYIGRIHPKWSEKLKIKQELALGEFQLDALLRGQPKLQRVESISKFPSVERDLAFLCNKDLPAQEIIDQMKKLAGKKLVDVKVFDVFEGGKLEANQKSLAFRLLFQDKQATLNDEEINQIQSKLIDQISSKLGVQVR